MFGHMDGQVAIRELESKYPQAIKIQRRLDSMLGDLTFTNGEESTLVAKKQMLLGLVSNLKRANGDLQTDLKKALPYLQGTQKLSWQRRCEKLDRDYELARISVNKTVGLLANQMDEEHEREQLLMSARQRRDKKRETMGEEALATEEKTRLEETGAALDAMIAQGGATIRNLVGQREVLARTGKRMHSALLSLGVSSSILTSVETRLRSDKFITFMGMLIVASTIYLFYCWWKSIHPFWWLPTSYLMAFVRLIFGLGRSGARPTAVKQEPLVEATVKAGIKKLHVVGTGNLRRR